LERRGVFPGAAVRPRLQPHPGRLHRSAQPHRRLEDGEKRLAQYKAALGQGADPAFVSAWINEATADITPARLDLAQGDNAVPQAMSREELEGVANDMSLIVARLAAADPATKAGLYRDRGCA
jgi:hypothetical protein